MGRPCDGNAPVGPSSLGVSFATVWSMLPTGPSPLDAERAFDREVRARRRADLMRRLRRRPTECGGLAVHRDSAISHSGARRRVGVHPIPLSAVDGTLEPSRARLFDASFRPAEAARARWQRIWLAEQRGAALPPISVVRIGNGYAVSDGHHRVSVARARGAVTIDATVDTTHGATAGALRRPRSVRVSGSAD
jgi:hypothetical protein